MKFHLKFSQTFILQTNFANAALGTIVSIQPKESSGGGGETREQIVFRQADEMLEKLPDNFLPHEVSPSILSSFNTYQLRFHPRNSSLWWFYTYT